MHELRHLAANLVELEREDYYFTVAHGRYTVRVANKILTRFFAARCVLCLRASLDGDMMHCTALVIENIHNR